MEWRRLFFWVNYVLGWTPWDTNTTPPELVRTIEGPDALAPGRALDLGCGTGTNVIYLAQRGWEATGVDFVERAIREARHKAHEAGVSVRLYTADVTRLERIEGLAATFDLALDIGCLHTLSPEQRVAYASGLAGRLRPGGIYLLYAWGRRGEESQPAGLSPAQVEALFAQVLVVRHIQQGEERGRPSAWYWLRKSER